MIDHGFPALDDTIRISVLDCTATECPLRESEGLVSVVLGPGLISVEVDVS